MAGQFSEGVLEQVRAASDIVDVIGAVLPLKRAGANFVALCPFHREKTPSFHVNPQRQIFHCFGCHKGGDVFRFIQDYENLSFPEAVRRLADRAKIPLEQVDAPGERVSRSLKDALLEIHEQIAQRWQQALAADAAGEIARAYLAKRGVSAEAIQLFRLGFAPDAWDDTVNWAKAKHHELPLVEKAGLIIRKDSPGSAHYYDRFRGRLIFPICDEQGRVVAFSGRILTADEQTAKYVNSPETPIFTKGKVFYGLDKAKRALLDAQFAIICEGQLDLIACYMGGLHNVVAPQGTAFTGDHARILKRYVNEVVLCFDSDTAGQSAAVRVLDSLLASGLAIRVATLPAPHDPDSYIKEHGGPAFQALIRGAQGFFDYYLDLLCAQNNVQSDLGQLNVARAMAEALRKTGSDVLLDKYAQKTALRLGVAPEAARAEFKKAPRARLNPQAENTPVEEPAPAPVSFTRPSAHETWLLKIVLLHDELVTWLAAHLDLAWLQHEGVREVVGLRRAADESQTWTGPASLLSQIGDDATRGFISELMAEARPVPNPAQQLQDIVLRLRNQSIDREMTALLQQANAPGIDETNHVQLLQRREALRMKKGQPLSPLAPTG
ncbi:MAG: DNA primase [Verrucomicrobiia bacterium]